MFAFPASAWHKPKRSYREWTKPEQQKLLDLITTMPVTEAAKVLHRPVGSVRCMLHRLGVGGTTGCEWFTKFSALRTRPEEIQKWIDRGWLNVPFCRSRLSKSEYYHRRLLPDCEKHGREAVSRRLSYEALWFVQNYVFPPSHAEMLDVREELTRSKPGQMKKRRALETTCLM